MAKKAADKTTKPAKATKAKPKAVKPLTARLTFTVEMEVVTLINIMPGYTPEDVLGAITSKRADFYFDIDEIEVGRKVLAQLKKPHIVSDEYDDFEIEPI